MTIIVDTSVLIDHLRGHPDARAVLLAAADRGDRLAGCVATKVEILSGMRSDEHQATRRLLDVLDWIAIDDDIAERAGALANQYLRSHPGIDTVDYLTAATSQETNARLWTRNLKHFPMLPDLVAPY